MPVAAGKLMNPGCTSHTLLLVRAPYGVLGLMAMLSMSASSVRFG
jgi:hypothetical protein